MASRDFSEPLTKAAMTALLADDGVAAIVQGRVRDYVEAKPTWPFLRLDPLEAAPFEASGWVGSDHTLTVHAYARGERGTGAVQTLAAAVVSALDEADLSLDAGNLLSLDHRRTLVLPDVAGPASWHAVITFAATVAALRLDA